MNNLTRNICLGLAVLALGLAPGVAFARHGADDGGAVEVGDDNGGDRPDGVSDDPAGDDNGGDRPDGVSDDPAGDDNGGLRSNQTRSARTRDEVRTGGTCTGRATASLKAKPDDGRLETEFEVDQNKNGVTWKVRIRLNGERVVKTRKTTTAPSGSFSLERRLANGPGADHIKARAISPSGQVCKASLTI